MSPVEDIATTIAASVRANGWLAIAYMSDVDIIEPTNFARICTLWCGDQSQAKRLVAMMRSDA